MTRFSLKTASL
jgi:hypothetical protein